MNYIIFIIGIFTSISIPANETEFVKIEDPRIFGKKHTEARREEILAISNKLEKKDILCVNEFLMTYQDKVFEHCVQDGYAGGIGGGCYHIVNFILDSVVVENALKECGIKVPVEH